MRYYNISTRTILTKEEAVELWKRKNGKSVLLTPTLPDKYLESCGIYRIYPNYLPKDVDDPDFSTFYIYPSIDIKNADVSKIRFDNVSGHYVYDIEPVFSKELFELAWASVRKQRDALLAQVDWVEASSEVTPATKKKIAAYKELLRKIPELFQSPVKVTFPTKPKIIFKSDAKKRTAASFYKSKEEVSELLNAKSNEAISYWISIGQPLEKSIVNNIIELYS